MALHPSERALSAITSKPWVVSHFLVGSGVRDSGFRGSGVVLLAVREVRAGCHLWVGIA